jgi:sulfatase modifying factor 1
VTGITVISGGSGYTGEPAVTFSGGGGSGATAKVILSGDKVAVVVVLTSGSGYSTAPTVVVEAPPKALSVRVRLVPELTVEGPPGSLAQVESSTSLTGPWTTWTNVTVGAQGTVLVDLSPGSSTQFYRSIADDRPVGPAGFVWIKPGTFIMGSPATEPERFREEIQHTVTLTKGFWMSDHEVTQDEYQAIVGTNPSRFKGPSHPVDQVSWIEAVDYCNKLTNRERSAGHITAQQAYRLPTEAEWEYAARAGTTGARYGELDAIAWHYDNHLATPESQPVKQKLPNAWGLYDMIGNVFEWCADWSWAYLPEDQLDPQGPTSNTGVRVIRGGSWGNPSQACRSACRLNGNPVNSSWFGGFRPVLSSVR